MAPAITHAKIILTIGSYGKSQWLLPSLLGFIIKQSYGKNKIWSKVCYRRLGGLKKAGQENKKVAGIIH